MNSTWIFNKNFLIFLTVLTFLTIYLIIKNADYLPLDPFSDIYYHLTISSQYLKLQQITTFNTWESLPWGHPQTYPPFFHVIISPLIKFFKFNLYTDKIVIAFSLILSGFLFSLGIFLIFRSYLISLLSFIISFTHLYFLNIHSMTLPALLVFSLSPLLFFFVKNKKYVSFVVLLIFIFYTHRYLPYLIFGSIILWSFFYDKKSLIKNILLILIAFVFYLPYLKENLKIGLNFYPYIGYSNIIQTAKTVFLFLPFDLLVILSFLFKNNFNQKDFNFFWILFIFLIPIWFFIPSRSSLASLRILILSPLAIKGLLALFSQKKTLGILFLIWLLTISLNLKFSFNKLTLSIEKSLLFFGLQDKTINQQLQQFKEKMYYLAYLVKKFSNPEEPFYFKTENFYHFKINPRLERVPANVISFFSQNPYLQRGVPEVFFYPEPDMNLAKIIILDQPINNQKILLEKIETDFQTFFVYLNPNYKKITLPSSKNFLPIQIAYFLIILGLILILIENYFQKIYSLLKIKFNLFK